VLRSLGILICNTWDLLAWHNDRRDQTDKLKAQRKS